MLDCKFWFRVLSPYINLLSVIYVSFLLILILKNILSLKNSAKMIVLLSIFRFNYRLYQNIQKRIKSKKKIKRRSFYFYNKPCCKALNESIFSLKSFEEQMLIVFSVQMNLKEEGIIKYYHYAGALLILTPLLEILKKCENKQCFKKDINTIENYSKLLQGFQVLTICLHADKLFKLNFFSMIWSYIIFFITVEQIYNSSRSLTLFKYNFYLGVLLTKI